MGRINLLDSSVYNQIAAGEVVESPASVVKELVENSIDAGATKITVMIEKGGIKSISVIDNGCGMEAEDLRLSILPHTTSKIKEAGDLFAIDTLGFRGEALASICSVAQVEILSRFLQAEIGHRLLIKGGEILEDEPNPIHEGTSVTINHFFYNTPVRFKFLKSQAGEEAAVSRVIAELIFSHPYIAIEYISDGKLVHHSMGKGLKESIFSIYGDAISVNMIPVLYYEEGYSIKGYIARPQSAAIRGNRNNQIFIVNGRVIYSDGLSAVVKNAYGEYLMKRTFPGIILDIVVPFDTVDVNVHPNKREVRFSNEKKIFGLIYHACKNALGGDAETKKIIIRNEITQKEKSQEVKDDLLSPISAFSAFKKEQEARKSETSKNIAEEEIKGVKAEKLLDMKEKGIPQETTDVETEQIEETVRTDMEETVQNSEKTESTTPELSDETAGIAMVIDSEQKETSLHPEGNGGYFAENELEIIQQDQTEDTSKQKAVTETIIAPKTKEAEEDRSSVSTEEILASAAESEETAFREESFDGKLTFADSNDYIGNFLKKEDTTDDFPYKIIGQLFDTYILLEVENKMYVIDQHAVHERILYDRLMSDLEKPMAQQELLYPYEINLNGEEKVFLKDKLPLLKKFGFKASFQGNFMVIHAVPHILYQTEIELFITGLLEEKEKLSLGKMQSLDYIQDRLAKTACRKAIKAGDKLGMSEIRYVLEYFFEHSVPLECPHGRPTIVTISKNALEKLFKRIV